MTKHIYDDQTGQLLPLRGGAGKRGKKKWMLMGLAALLLLPFGGNDAAGGGGGGTKAAGTPVDAQQPVAPPSPNSV